MCFSLTSLVLTCSMMSLKEGEKSRTVVPLSCRGSDQTTLMMRFAWTLTGSLSTRPQQLFSVVLCSQNAMLHTPPGTRWRCYRGMAWRSFKDKCVEGWKRVGEQRSAIDRTERWASFPVAPTPFQHRHPDWRLGSGSALIQQLCKMNQCASRSTSSKDNNCLLYLYLPAEAPKSRARDSSLSLQVLPR